MKKLKLLFQCDSYTELAGILGVRRTTLYLWKKEGIPEHMKGLLNLIEKQQTDLIRMRKDGYVVKGRSQRHGEEDYIITHEI